jgi:hypothetical protein
MDSLAEHSKGVIIFLYGMVLAGAARQVYAEHKSIFATVLRLTFGIAIAALGLLDLCGLFTLTLVSFGTTVGIGSIIIGVSALAVPPAPKSPRWTQWAQVAIGAIFILLSLLMGPNK